MKIVTNTVKNSLFIGMLICLEPSIISAQTEYVLPFTKENISPVRVVVNDHATNGCWTNLNEAKDYAEGQLDLAGIEVAKGDVARTYLSLGVSSERAENGLCYGGVASELFGWVDWGDGRAYVRLIEVDYSFANAKNANVDILDLIKEMSTRVFIPMPDRS